jgi:hypothetical protein
VNQIIFQTRKEPSEGAFFLAVPQGWLIEGGIVRANFNMQTVSAQNIASKVDFTVKKDPPGTVMVRWCPETKFVVVTSGMGYFPPGSNYMGATVYPLVPAAEFIPRILFPWAHSQAMNAQMLESKNDPELYRKRQERNAASVPIPFQYDGASATYLYDEGGVRYKEKAFVAIEAMNTGVSVMWSNFMSVYYRAPEAQFADWEATLAHICLSAKNNPEWEAREQMSQGVLSQSFLNAQAAEQYRAQRALDFQRQMQDEMRQIVDHRQKTYAEIRNDQYLTMTNQEEYLNPYTNLVDTGSNQWNYRWVNADGDEFYSNSESDNPNALNAMSRSDWKSTPIRPRFPDGPAPT